LRGCCTIKTKRMPNLAIAHDVIHLNQKTPEKKNREAKAQDSEKLQGAGRGKHLDLKGTRKKGGWGGATRDSGGSIFQKKVSG